MAKTNWQYNDVVKETDLNQIGQEINAAAASAASAQQNLTTHNTAAVLDHPDGSVTTAKLAAKAVTQAKIGDKSVGQGQIGDKAVGSGQLADGAATDTVIGTRTVADTAAPTGDSGTITALLGWMANMVKSITGKSNWRTAPATSLEAAKAHMDASTGVHGATSSANSNALMQRDASGRVQVAAPSASADVARKDTVDGAMSSHVGAADPHSQYVQKTGGTMTGPLSMGSGSSITTGGTTFAKSNNSILTRYQHGNGTNELDLFWASSAAGGDSRIIYAPRVSGATDYSKEFSYNFAGNRWEFDEAPYAAGNPVLTSGTHNSAGDPHTQYLQKAGGSMSGTLKFGGNMDVTNGGAIDMANGDIIKANSIYFNDAADSGGEGLMFAKSGITSGSAAVSDYTNFKVDGEGIGYIGGAAVVTSGTTYTGDLNLLLQSGIYTVGNTVANIPESSTFVVFVSKRNSTTTYQMAMKAVPTDPKVWVRVTADTGATWGQWRSLATTDAAQMSKITTDTGSFTINASTSSDDVLAMIIAKGSGMNTIYCNNSALNVPASSSFRGISFGSLSGANWFGYVMLVGADKQTYTNYCNGTSGWLGWKTLVNSDSPSFTGNSTFAGTVTSPTPTTGDNSTKVATTAFVKTAVDNAKASPAFTGVVTASNGTLGSAVNDALESFKSTGSVGGGSSSGLVTRLRRNAAGTGWPTADLEILRRTDVTDQQGINFAGDGKIKLIASTSVESASPVGITTGAQALSLYSGNQDHAYMAFYPRTATPANRGGYFGFGSPGYNHMSLVNSIGDIYVSPSTAGNYVYIGANARFSDTGGIEQYNGAGWVKVGGGIYVVSGTEREKFPTEVSHAAGSSGGKLIARFAPRYTGELRLTFEGRNDVGGTSYLSVFHSGPRTYSSGGTVTTIRALRDALLDWSVPIGTVFNAGSFSYDSQYISEVISFATNYTPYAPYSATITVTEGVPFYLILACVSGNAYVKNLTFRYDIL